MKIFTLTDLIVIFAGFIYLVFFVVLYLQGLGNKKLFEQLNDEDYPFHEMYFVGYRLTQILGLNYKSKQARNLRRQLGSLYEEKYASYYLRVVYSQRFTMALIVIAFATPLYCLSGSLAVYFLVLAGGVAAYIYYGKATKDLIDKKADDILTDFSEVVSKLALLVNSGMILVDAWEQVAMSSNGLIYDEMKRSVLEIKNGVSASDAFQKFGQRCLLPEIRKFTSTLIQGMIKGNQELTLMLTEQSSEVWNRKKQLVKQKGELADNKLLLPMCITFAGILVMVIVPIFTNIGA